MRKDFVLPDLGKDAPDEAKVSFWYKDAGAAVAKDEDLIEMVTDKASFTVPSPTSGTLVAVSVGEGDVVKVGGRLGVIETKD